jgi:6-phosphogluconate dehydrogenase
MQIGLIGLGRMGMNMGRRWLRGGHEIIAFNRTYAKTEELAKDGAKPAKTIADLVKQLKAPRIVWLMLPAGAATDEHLAEVAGLLSPGDLVVDGANNYFKDDMRHSSELAPKKISFMDAGVSGGIWGLQEGYCTMVGGDAASFARLEPLLKTLAPKDGYLHCGGVGAGHFVKMVHNGIEYGMMQAFAEGFEILAASPYKPDPEKVAHLWNQGSVVRSWLLELAEDAFKKTPGLEGLSGYVEDSGEGRWTVQQAIDSGVSAPVITLSLFQRFVSRQKDSFSFRVLAALRNEFGGHAVHKASDDVRSSQAGAGSIQAASAELGVKPHGL